jgi:hypothetical protein
MIVNILTTTLGLLYSHDPIHQARGISIIKVLVNYGRWMHFHSLEHLLTYL